jgi:hypothetical protein
MATKKTTTKAVKNKPSVWQTLSAINCNEHVKKKGQFKYLTWTWAWAILMEHYPSASFENHYNDDGYPCFLDHSGNAMVRVSVTIEGVTRTEDFAVTDNRNNSINEPSSSEVNTALKRCLVKCLAYSGLGHYIYSGDDLPQGEDKPAPAATPEPTTKKASKAQLDAVRDKIEGSENPDNALLRTLAWAGVSSLELMSQEHAAKLLSAK